VGVLAAIAIFTPRASTAPEERPRPFDGVSVSVAASNSLPAAPRPTPKPTPTPEPRWDEDVNAVPPAGGYVRSLRVRATAYMPIDTPMEGGRYTCTQRDGRSAHGIAVDPDVIPLGSHLWVPGYGHALADDVGGAIDGRRIDLRMQTYREMDDWGVRRVRVYVLQEP
jgi:3D (Asp-Asp-Asp) domain-containing protein